MMKNIKALILDMDGVIWRADSPIGDLRSIFERVRGRGWKFIFATNNSTKTPQQYADILAGFGVEIEPSQAVTSPLAVAAMMGKKLPRGGKVFVIGEDGVRVALEENGFEVLDVEHAQDAQAVVAGLDRAVNFQKMSEAALLIRRGVPFYATNPDKTFPTPRGQIPGAGAWTSVLITATNVEPIYGGKPFPYLMEIALERLGTKKEETLVVGDRVETDVAAGQAVGCPCALVLSGVTTRAQADAWTPKIDWIAEDLESLVGEV